MSRLLAPAAAGVVAALAYLGAQAVDRRIVNARSDDLLLLGGLVTARPSLWRPLGLIMHLGAGAAFAMIFDRLGAPLLPGPFWLRGLLMAQLENAALWPLVVLIDTAHPAVKTGALAPLNRPVYFGQAVWRHLALGVVLGLLLTPCSRPDASGRPASR